MKNHLAIGIGAFVLAAAAHASAPTVDSITPGLSFGEYSGAAPVGQGQVDTDMLFYIDELVGPLGKAWYIFFDPRGPDSVIATLSFESAITGVFSTKAELDGSNATYGNSGITYGTSTLIGLEDRDTYSVVGNKLMIDWHAIDPGDHIRVFTAPVTPPIPEPQTLALLVAGLSALAFVQRRRVLG